MNGDTNHDVNSDQLRRRLTAADPMIAGAPTDPADSPSARTLLEAVMTHDANTTDPNTTDSTTHATSGASVTNIDTKRRWPIVGLGAAAVTALVVGGAAVGGVFEAADDEPGGDDIAVEQPAPGETTDETIGDATGGESGDQAVDVDPGDATVLALSAGTADPAMMSCIRPDATVVAQSPTAFRGIVDSIGGDADTEQVTLTVDRWYVGGDADVVTIAAPLGLEALTGSIDFVEGEPYLISAFDGTVSYCGLSGAATPELQAMYDEAFPG